LLANTVAIAPFAWAAFMQRNPSAYAAGVQEDGALEWMTFWGFVLAAALFLYHTRAERRAGGVPWFALGLSLFCLVVALEEISWGQRVFGYRPPTYFLERNYQQELNLHNLVDTSLRKFALSAIIVGYGILLPVAGLVRPTRALLKRLRITPPPWRLIPTFLAAVITYETYPWKYTGELVELVLAMAFLFSALISLPPGRRQRSPSTLTALPLMAALLVFMLGSASGRMSLAAHRAHPDNLEAARSEAEALKLDLLALASAELAGDGDGFTRCGLHKRVYTWVTREKTSALYEGHFAALVTQGLQEERADFFIDPWNSPYWVRHRCTRSKERITVYSFGPNRRRDSSRSALAGDDVGVTIERPRESSD
jgi:hypothetical protein